MNEQQRAQFVAKINLYLDNALTEKEELELLQEIQTNPAYAQMLNQERSFRDFIKAKITRRTPSPALIETIKQRISSIHV